MWRLAEYIEEIAIFIGQIPVALSDITNPLFGKIHIGQLAVDIRRLKEKLNEQIDFHDLDTNPIYQQALQLFSNFLIDSLPEEEKQLLLSDSISFNYDNPIFEEYILLLFALCIKESILAKTRDYKRCSEGLAMTILNVASIQNMMRDYASAEEGANISIRILNNWAKLDANTNIDESMAQAYSVLYTSAANLDMDKKAQTYRNKMLEYTEKIYIKNPRQNALTFTDMLFHAGIDYLHESNYQMSIKIFGKLLVLFERIKEEAYIDENQYLIPFMRANLKWIEACRNYEYSNEKFKSNYSALTDHSNKALTLCSKIEKSKAFNSTDKAHCELEVLWCNLQYLPPMLVSR